MIDMNPSLRSINRNLLMTSDYFIVPTTPDYYSVMAIDSLTKVIPSWYKWSKKAQILPVLQKAAYPFPKVTPLFIGTIVQNYRPRGGNPTRGFQKWIDQINQKVRDQLFPALREAEMTLSIDMYEMIEEEAYCLAAIRDFNSLIAKSQEYRTPVFALTEEQIGQVGTVLDNTKDDRDSFKEIFSDLTDKVVQLTS